jgi:hypothetical protein
MLVPARFELKAKIEGAIPEGPDSRDSARWLAAGEQLSSSSLPDR